QTRSVRALLDFPALHPAHPVWILKLPFEDAAALEFRHYRRVRHFSLPDSPVQPHFHSVAKLNRAALHLELQVEFASIPRAHAVGHEKSSDDFRRSANFLNESQISHRSPVILPEARAITNCASPSSLWLSGSVRTANHHAFRAQL